MFSSVLRVTAGFGLVALIASACATPGGPQEDETFELGDDDPSEFQGQGNIRSLSPFDLATHLADRAHLQDLVRGDEPLELDFADEAQYRFVLLRLKIAGKTPATSPQLFKGLEALRQEHVKRAEGGTGVASSAIQAKQVLTSKHYFNSLNVGTSSMTVLATGSVREALFYGYVDAAPWDENDAQIGDMAYTEVYSNMPYHHAKATGDLAQTSASNLKGDSMLIQDTVQNGYKVLYIVAANARPIGIDTPTITQPIDAKYNDNCISICLNRAWTNDCDYDLTGTQTALKIPLQGSITIKASSPNHAFDPVKINEYKAGTATDSAGNPTPAARSGSSSPTWGAAATSTRTMPSTAP